MMQIFFINFAVNIFKFSNTICLRDLKLQNRLFFVLNCHCMADIEPNLDAFTMKTSSQICAVSVWVLKGGILKNSVNNFSQFLPNLFRQGWSKDKNWPVTYQWSLSMVLADSNSLFLMSKLELVAYVMTFDHWILGKIICKYFEKCDY